MNIILEMLNKAGLRFVEFASPMLIQSSILILILLAADFLLRKKVRATFRYWIWMLVLIKLILPVSLYSPLSLGSWLGEKIEYANLTQKNTGERAIKSENIINFKSEIRDFRPIEPRVESSESVPSDTHTIITNPLPASPEHVVTEKPVKLSWQAVLFIIWISISAGLVLVLLKRTVFIKELVTKASDTDFNDDKSVSPKDVLRHCCIYLGMKKQIPLKISPDATSPVVCGLLQPVILLPQNLISSLNPGQLKAIFFHEIAHIKRGDLWVNLLQTLLQITYFYNPLLWLANSIIRRTREQAVDEMVLVAMGKDAREYPETLLNVAKLAFKRPALSLRLIGVVESENALTSRIKHMLSRPLPKTAKLGLLGLLVIIIFAAILLPMAKKENKLRLKNIEFSINRNDDEENADIKTQYAGASELMKVYVEALLDNNENVIADITSNANENTKKLRLSFNEIDKIKQLDIKSYSPSSWRTLTIKQSDIKAKVGLFGTGTIKLIDGVRHSLFAIITQINEGPWQLKNARWYRIGTDIEESGKLLSKELAESAIQLAGIVRPDENISTKDKEDLEKEFVRLNEETLKLLKSKESSDSDSTLYSYKISPADESVVVYSFPFFEALRKGDLDSEDITTPAVLKKKLERITELCNLDNIEIEEIYSSHSFAIILTKGIQRRDNLPYQLGFTFLCSSGQWLFNDTDWLTAENRQNYIDGFKNNFPDVTRVFSSDYYTTKNTTSNGLMKDLESWGDIVNGIRVHLSSKQPLGLYFSDNSLWYEIENNSRNTIEINTQPYAQKGTDKSQSGYLEIVDANDKAVEYKCSTENNFRKIKSGESYNVHSFVNGRPLRSAGPGTYKVRVTLVARDVETDEIFEVQSNWHEFEVTPCGFAKDFIPQKPDEELLLAEAYQSMMGNSHATIKQVIDMFEDIIKKYPDSKYELKSHFDIALMASESRDPDLVTESDYAMSRKHYQEIIRKWPDVVTADTIHARFQAYFGTPEFEQSRLDLYKWLKSLTREQKMNSIGFVNPARRFERTKEDIQRWVDSITDNINRSYLPMLEQNLKELDIPIPAGPFKESSVQDVNAIQWGEEVNGVKARLVSHGNYILYHEKPNINLEVINESGQKIEVIYPPVFEKSRDQEKGQWSGFGEIEIYNKKDERFNANSGSHDPYNIPVNNNSNYNGECGFGSYFFHLPEPGKYKARVTFGVQSQDGKTFKVTTGWLEFDALLTKHIPGTPYTPEEDLEEAMAYDSVLLQRGKVSREEAVDRFLAVAEKYPDTLYELKGLFWAAVILSQRLILPDNHPTEEQQERARLIKEKIVGKWPDLITHETISARTDLAAVGSDRFEKLLDFYDWLTAIPEEDRIAAVDSKLTHLESYLTTKNNLWSNEQLQTIINRYPNTHFAELAEEELKKQPAKNVSAQDVNDIN